MVKHLPAMQETWVQSLDWEGPLEKEMATHSSILAWEMLWTEEPNRQQSMLRAAAGVVGIITCYLPRDRHSLLSLRYWGFPWFSAPIWEMQRLRKAWMGKV